MQIVTKVQTMTSRRKILSGLLASGVIMTCALPASAHRQMQAISTITWNPKTKNLEIIHTVHLHDAEQALARLGRISSPDLTPLRARANLALYARERFSVRALEGHRLDLNIIGAEVDSTYAYIYHEIPMNEAPKGLILSSTLLHEIYPDQANQVNITLPTINGHDITKSLMFRLGDRSKTIVI